MNKPKRIKIEVLVTKGNKILLCKFHSGDKSWYAFPGGGVEPGDTYEETATKECLEEVGVLIKDIKSLDLSKEYPPSFMNKGRDSQYSGGIQYLYWARFDKIDLSLFGKDGDAVDYDWVTLDFAADKVKQDAHFGEIRYEAVMKLKSLV